MVTAKKCIIPYNYAPDKVVEETTNTLKGLFKENVEIINKNISPFNDSSGHVYLPKKHVGKVVTIIIWEGKEQIYKKRGEYG